MQQDDRQADSSARATGGRALQVVGAVLAVLLLGVGAGLLVGQVAAEEAEPLAGDGGSDGQRSVVLLTGGGVEVDRSTLTAMGARGTADVLEGAGFRTGRVPLGQRVTRYLPDPDLDLVMVQGGEVDPEPDPANEARRGGVRIGAIHLIDRVKAGAGVRTQIVLVGPVPASANPPGAMLAVRDELEAAAQSRGIPFLDPNDLGWRLSDDDLSDKLAEALVPLLPQGS